MGSNNSQAHHNLHILYSNPQWCRATTLTSWNCCTRDFCSNRARNSNSHSLFLTLYNPLFLPCRASPPREVPGRPLRAARSTKSFFSSSNSSSSPRRWPLDPLSFRWNCSSTSWPSRQRNLPNRRSNLQSRKETRRKVTPLVVTPRRLRPRVRRVHPP